MKALTFSRVLNITWVMLGLLFAWDACLAQEVDISMKVGNATRCCHQDPCDWHNIDCKDSAGKTCTETDACCRGPNTGDGTCTTAGGTQCDFTNCYPRHEENCLE